MSGASMSWAARVGLLAAALALWGCPVPPRPQELDDLKLMLESDVVAQAAPRAPDAVAAARETQADAEAAWDGGNLELSARLSRLAQVQVRLAVALARQDLATERRAESEQALAEAQAAYQEIESRRQVLEERLARLWAYRRVREEVARERAQAVEEEALRAERLSDTERATWEKNWRAQARADAAEARRTLEVARMLGVEQAYPEAERMAREAIDTALEAVDTSPWRIERPLADYATAQADELRFRMLSLGGDGGPEAMAQQVQELVASYRTGFDPPFTVSLDPRGVLLSLDARAAEIEVAFPEPSATALRDLRAKWTAEPALRLLVTVRSLDPDCGDTCLERTSTLAARAAAEASGVPLEQVVAAGGTGGEGLAGRVRALGLGFSKEETLPSGLPKAGSIRIEFLLFPAVEVPETATVGHMEDVSAGSQ
jgi:hypothetical protein